MRRVLLGTPTYDYSMDARYVHSLGQTIKACIENQIDLRWLFPIGEVIQVARDGILRDAVKHGFDDLVWIDRDQDWEAADFIKTLNYPVDCVGAPVRRKTYLQEIYNVRAAGGPHSLVKDLSTGLMTAPDLALGCGFMRLSKKAFTALWDNAMPYSVYMNDEPSRRVFDWPIVKGELHSEDTEMCDRLRELGFDIWVDPNQNPGHSGMMRFEGNFLNWLEKARAANPKPEVVIDELAETRAAMEELKERLRKLGDDPDSKVVNLR